MNIASCLNEYYVPYTYMMLKSLFASNRRHDICVYLLHDGLSEEAASNFDALARSYTDGKENEKRVELIRVEDFSMNPKIYTYGGWNELTMYRLLLWDILPASVDRVLHLDGDMIINKDLMPLYETDFEGKDLIACADILAATDRKEYCIATHKEVFRSYFETGTYINAGMLLMNVKKNRGTGLLSVYEKTAEELDFVLPFPDQDLLNHIHHDSIKYADTLTYNFPAYDGTALNGGYDYDRAKKEVAIFHYLDKKPWNEGDHEIYDLERFFWDTTTGTVYEETLRKELTVAILVLEEDTDVEATKASASEVLHRYFRHTRLLEVRDALTKDYENLAQLKNEVLLREAYDRILFVTAGETLGRIEAIEAQDPTAVREILLTDGISAFDRIIYDRTCFEELGIFADLNNDEAYEMALRAYRYQRGRHLQLFREDAVTHPVFEDTYRLYAYEFIAEQSFLKERNLFDTVFQSRFEEAKGYGIGAFFSDAVKQAAEGDRAYGAFSGATKPIVFLEAVSECQGAMDSFAKEFGASLRNLGCGVIYASAKDEILLLPLKAVIGFQTKIYGAKLASGNYLGNLMDAPKFNFQFDHPIYMTQEFEKPIEDLFVLSQDETYAAYINDWLPHVKKAYHFPPAGIEAVTAQKPEKVYDMVFIGTYNDYRLQEQAMETLPQNYLRISRKFYDRQKVHPNERAEEALERVLFDLGYEVDRQQFTETLFAMGHAVRALMYYYREKVIQTLLDGGIVVDVFSDSWKNAPFAHHKNLVLHDSVGYEEGLAIMAQSKTTLNVMSWHKGGMTERLNNAMMNHSLCVTDRSTYIEREYANEMLLFDLENFSDLPEWVRHVLNEPERLVQMTERAYQKAFEEQTWDVRAKEFLENLNR